MSKTERHRSVRVVPKQAWAASGCMPCFLAARPITVQATTTTQERTTSQVTQVQEPWGGGTARVEERRGGKRGMKRCEEEAAVAR